MSLIYSSPDIDFCHCVLESMISKGMHQSLARLRWMLPYSKLLDSSDSHVVQLDDIETSTHSSSNREERSICVVKKEANAQLLGP
jgi:hypothetical protein